MSEAALARIEQSQEALLAALDSNDLAAIESGVAALRAALSAAPEGWAHTSQTRAAAERVAQLAQAAQMRVNFLTDMVRRRLERLSLARGRAPDLTYQSLRR